MGDKIRTTLISRNLTCVAINKLTNNVEQHFETVRTLLIIVGVIFTVDLFGSQYRRNVFGGSSVSYRLCIVYAMRQMSRPMISNVSETEMNAKLYLHF